MLGRPPGRLRLGDFKPFLPQIVTHDEAIGDALEHVVPIARPERDLKVKVHLRRVVQQLERLPHQEMHARRGKLKTIIAPVEDQLLCPHGQREAGKERNYQPP